MMFDDLMAAGSREVAGKMAGRRCGRAEHQMEADEHMTDRYMYVSIRRNFLPGTYVHFGRPNFELRN